MINPSEVPRGNVFTQLVKVTELFRRTIVSFYWAMRNFNEHFLNDYEQTFRCDVCYRLLFSLVTLSETLKILFFFIVSFKIQSCSNSSETWIDKHTLFNLINLIVLSCKRLQRWVRRKNKINLHAIYSRLTRLVLKKLNVNRRFHQCSIEKIINRTYQLLTMIIHGKLKCCLNTNT